MVGCVGYRGYVYILLFYIYGLEMVMWWLFGVGYCEVLIIVC